MKNFVIASNYIMRWSFLSLVFFASCSVTGPLRTDPKAARIETGDLPRPWQKQEIEEKDSTADLIYLNPQSSAYISFNSMCRRYPDSTLENLASQLLGPMAEQNILSQEKFKLDEREALLTKVEGTLDGVKVEARFVVVRKNECVFDFSLVARDQIKGDDEKSFTNFYKDFRYLGGVKE